MAYDADHDRTARDAAAENLEHEHPAKPEQTDDEGFEQGYDQHRDTPEEELEPNFARGISEEPPGGERHGRFSTGGEETARHAGEGGRAPLQRGRRAEPDEQLITPRARPAATTRC